MKRRLCVILVQMKTFKNTAQKGSVRYIIFQDKKDGLWYGVALEFNIVESAEDPRVAIVRLFEAIQGYVESFKKVHGARPYPLNQEAEKVYENLWDRLRHNKPIRSPFTIDSFGTKQLVFA